MKKTFQLFLLTFSVILLAACDNSLQRADRSIGLIQENVTQIVNELNEVQVLENNLQSDFETMLQSSEDLGIFDASDSLVQVNIDNRKDHLTSIAESISKLNELINELENVKKSDAIPTAHTNAINAKNSFFIIFYFNYTILKTIIIVNSLMTFNPIRIPDQG